MCRFCYEDDLYTVSSAYHHRSCDAHEASTSQHPYHDFSINSLKHRLLVYLYRRAVAEARVARSPKAVLLFFQLFDEFRQLRMWKMQLLDENHLLIRYWCFCVRALAVVKVRQVATVMARYDTRCCYNMQSTAGMSQLNLPHATNNYNNTNTRLTALCPRLPRWAGTRKVKPIWILLKQETVSGSGISWAICKSAPRSRQITTPAPTTQFFSGQMPFLPSNQQRQSSEGNQLNQQLKMENRKSKK